MSHEPGAGGSPEWYTQAAARRREALRMSVTDSVNRLAKWRSVFAGWQLGTRASDDPECQAVRDHREATILLRAETTTLVALLMKKGVFTAEEFTAELGAEAERLSADYSRRFLGMTATDAGIAYSMPEAAETMKGWRP